MKTLIAYFSWSNNTLDLVNEVNKEFNFDIFRIERTIAYSNDYNECAYVEAKNEVDNNIHPDIKDINFDLNSYDRILLFFPIWWYTFPMCVGSFIEKLNGYKGKVILFENSYTNDNLYIENCLKNFRIINKDIDVRNGLFNKSDSEHIKFIKNI